MNTIETAPKTQFRFPLECVNQLAAHGTCHGCPMLLPQRTLDLAIWPQTMPQWLRTFSDYWAHWGTRLTPRGNQPWFQSRGIQNAGQLYEWWQLSRPVVRPDGCGTPAPEELAFVDS